ncbi:sigma-70 family RNA polymerase sigma factor [Streptomyces sp. NPDC002952]|uniref:sigma-70 family RNA polymerase sigma factor n=1 Tax=Streptomyces sp. NPDC002952 TaxID=3364673 RepID=UPI00369F3BDF
MADRDRPRSRHAEALAELVEERYDRMVRYAARRLRDRDVPQTSADPEDVVQNAIKSVLAQDKPIGNVRQYLYTCMDNEIAHAARNHYKGRGYESLDADVRLEDEPAVRPVDEAELRHVIDEALTGLPLQQRRAMLLTRELGMTQAEAARVMGAATATVGVHTHRAIAALRVALAGVGTALVGWATGSMAFGSQQIIPGAGPETPPVLYTLTMMTLIVVGLTSTGLVGVLSASGRGRRRLPFGPWSWAALRTGPDQRGPREYKESPPASHIRVVEAEKAETGKPVVHQGGLGGRRPRGKTRGDGVRRTDAEVARARERAARALQEGIRKRSRSSPARLPRHRTDR